MRQKLLLILWLLSVQFIEGQVIINPQLPALGLTIKPQLWNLALMNIGSGDINVKVEVVITDVSNSQHVLTGVSQLITLPRGIRQVSVTDVSPVTYTQGPGYITDPNPNGFLPVGVFNICYTAVKWVNDASEVMGEECVTVEVEPISPPQLIMPADSEHVIITRPFFAWLPPSPFNTFSSLLYDWLLVEVGPTQSAADAIQQNIPVLSQQNVMMNSFQYPLAMDELDTSKVYAWRVTAKNNSSPVANSETWSFRVKKFGLDTATILSTGYFVRLRKEIDASYIICTGVLRYEYQQDINSNMISLAITDLTGVQHQALQMDSAHYTVKYGQNFMQLDLRETAGLINKHIYLLDLVNAKLEHWYLKFEYRDPENN